MKISAWISLFALVAGVCASQSALRLHYDQPATVWTEALPIGNGRLGAMVFGGIKALERRPDP